MREASQLKIFLSAMAICAGLIATLCLTFWLDAACQVDGRRVAMKAAGGVGCFEFWFNRYQTLTAAIIGASVALFVVRPVFQQLREMTRQSAVAVRSAYVQRLGNLEAEAKRYLGIARTILETERLLTKKDYWLNVDMAELDGALARLEQLKRLVEEASTSKHVTEDAQVSGPDNIYAMLFAYTSSARSMISGARNGNRTKWRSCYPMIDGETVDLRGILHGMAVSLQPAIRSAREALKEVDDRIG